MLCVGQYRAPGEIVSTSFDSQNPTIVTLLELFPFELKLSATAVPVLHSEASTLPNIDPYCLCIDVNIEGKLKRLWLMPLDDG